MRSQTLITALLDSIRELTQCDSANLFFPANHARGLNEQLYRVGDHTLVEFEEQQQSLRTESLGTVSQHLDHPVYKGAEDNTFLFSLSNVSHASNKNSQGEESRRSAVAKTEASPSCWVGLKYNGSAVDWLLSDSVSNATPSVTECNMLNSLLHMAALQMSQMESDSALLIDPLTCLPSRTRFQSQVAQLCQQHTKVAVLMVHANEFHNINKKFGHELGDKVIWEISLHLLNMIRESDLVSRFGGALFAIGVPFDQQSEIIALGEKLQLSLQQPEYLSGELSLGFDIGIGTLQADEQFSSQIERVASVINKADQALKASQIKSTPTVTLWQQEQMDTYAQQADYIGGIFTADTATDYRNMLLLWDISNIIASQNQFTELLQLVIQRLAQTFDFECSGIIQSSEEGGLLQNAFSVNEAARAFPVSTLNPGESELVTNVADAVAQSVKAQYSDKGQLAAFAAPLDELGRQSFFLCGPSDRFVITHDGQTLFAALTKQLGRALNRARLEQQLNAQLEAQKQQLQEELAELKHGLMDSNMYYCSQAMELLMKQAKRAAMTDTTTLIIGESGTGKERLVHSLHKMGNRKEKPLVVVDCGAIPETLIESELFGHVKGAFTGAQNASKGKVHEADGGTLMLDEIGELPLRMQTKLLRFVQEKQFTQVGGTKTETVDIKIIAVTNRELEEEVSRGNFRQDLFYRLNVLTLRTPPLRERPDDIPLLSKHFLRKFAKQFGHEVLTLTPEATQNMLAYEWPGNIRELENRLMQATLLSENSIIDWPDLKIDSQPQGSVLPNQVADINDIPSSPVPQAATVSDRVNQNISKDTFLAQLKQTFEQQIQQIITNEDISMYPLGKWMEEDLIRQTHINTGEKTKQTGSRLGISISTLRRKLDKSNASSPSQSTVQNVYRQNISSALGPVSQGSVNLGPDCMQVLQLHLLDSLLTHKSLNMTTVSALLGVSEPTMYKLKKLLSEQSAKQHTGSLLSH